MKKNSFFNDEINKLKTFNLYRKIYQIIIIKKQRTRNKKEIKKEKIYYETNYFSLTYFFLFQSKTFNEYYNIFNLSPEILENIIFIS